MLDVYLSDEYYSKHWPEIQRCAWSDAPEDFEKLKGYALEANRLAPAAFGLLRKSNVDTIIDDNGTPVQIKVDDAIFQTERKVVAWTATGRFRRLVRLAGGRRSSRGIRASERGAYHVARMDSFRPSVPRCAVTDQPGSGPLPR